MLQGLKGGSDLVQCHYALESESEATQLCLTLCDPMDTRLLCPWDFLGKSTVGLPFPSPGNFPTRGSNPGLPHCRQTLYCLSHQGSQRKPPECTTGAHLMPMAGMNFTLRWSMCRNCPISIKGGIRDGRAWGLSQSSAV